MQTIWSRVAQTRGTCKCPQCLSYAKGIARRATASATRPVPKIWTSSTFWYSGIFAAAATWDARVKVERREQWDKVIGDLRKEVGQPVRVEEAVATLAVKEEAVEVTNEVESTYQPFYAPPKKTEEVANDNDTAAPADPDPSLDQYQPLDGSLEADHELFSDCDPAIRRAVWPVNTGPSLQPFFMAPQSIYAAEELRERGEACLWDSKKILTVQASMEVFLYRLFMELQCRDGLEEAAASVPEHFAKAMLQDQRELEKQLESRKARLDTIKRMMEPFEFEDFHRQDSMRQDRNAEFCGYGQDRDGKHLMTNRQLNNSLRQLFQRGLKQEISISTLLAKVAFNLSTSSAPPNVNTYNILLLGFSELKEHKMAAWIIKSIFQTHIRYNEVTCAAILDHYTENNFPHLFVKHLERMRGKHGGPMLARPDLEVHEGNAALLQRKDDQPEKIIQLPTPTPYVLRAIISGMLKFAGFDAALKICQKMMKEGWGVGIAGLTPLLRDCADQADWEGGQAIWAKMLSLKAISRKKEGDVVTTEKIGMEGFVAMLRLCLRCRKRQWYDETWALAERTHTRAGDTELIMERLRAQEGLKPAGRQRKSAENVQEAANIPGIPDVQNIPDIQSSIAELERKEATDQESSQAGIRHGHEQTSMEGELTVTLEQPGVDAKKAHQIRAPIKSHPVKKTMEVDAELEDIDELRVGSVGARHHAYEVGLPLSDLTSDAGSIFDPSSSVRTAHRPSLGPVDVHQEQLLGNLPASHDFGEYELSERPMHQRG